MMFIIWLSWERIRPSFYFLFWTFLISGNLRFSSLGSSSFPEVSRARALVRKCDQKKKVEEDFFFLSFFDRKFLFLL